MDESGGGGGTDEGRCRWSVLIFWSCFTCPDLMVFR